MHKVYVLMVVALCAGTPFHAHATSGDFFARAIRALMPDAPEMVEIARCESGLRQFTEGGAVLRGGLRGQMIGLFQFYETYHRTAAQQAGYDLDTVLGNIGYARTLYRTQGTAPWLSSAHCWQQKVAVPTVPLQKSNTITQTLRYGVTHPDVAVLKDLLIDRGYLSSTSTVTGTYFDTTTLKALLAFQCAEKLACIKGDVGMQGIGRVSGATLARINTLLANSSSAKLSAL